MAVNLNDDDTVKDVELVNRNRESLSQSLVAEMMILTGQVIGELGEYPLVDLCPITPCFNPTVRVQLLNQSIRVICRDTFTFRSLDSSQPVQPEGQALGNNQ